MPSIVIVADDGTKFELPEESADFSELLKGAMEQWSRRHDTAITTPSSMHPVGDGAQPSDDEEDDSTAEDVGRRWPLDGDDASTCSQLSDFPEEDRYFQGASRIGLKQSVERLPTDGFLGSHAAPRQRHDDEDEDAVLADEAVVPVDGSGASPPPRLQSSGADVVVTGAVSDTDSDRTASIAPDVDSRSHSTTSSQGSFVGGVGMSTPPRMVPPGQVTSPANPDMAAPPPRRNTDDVNVGSDDDDDSSTESEEAPSTNTGPTADACADRDDDSVTPSSLSEEQEEREEDDDVTEVRVSGGSSTGTGRRSVSAHPADADSDAEPEPQQAPVPEPMPQATTSPRTDSNASTPETLSPTQRADSDPSPLAQEEEEVVGRLHLDSPTTPTSDREADEKRKKKSSEGYHTTSTDATHGENTDESSTRSVAANDEHNTPKHRLSTPQSGQDAPLRGVGRPNSAQQEQEAEEEARLTSPLAGGSSGNGSQRSSGTSGSSSSHSAEAGERHNGHPHAGSLTSSLDQNGSGGAVKKSVLSLREQLREASLRHDSDEDSSADEDNTVEPMRLSGGPSSHVHYRDPQGRLTSPPSSGERGSSGKFSSGGGDSVTAVRKAYTVVVSAAEPLADDDEEDEEDDSAFDERVEGPDGEEMGGDNDGAITPRADILGAGAQMHSPVDAGMPSSVSGSHAKGAMAGTSPHNYHQRTPVMIGADEECVHLLSSEGHATIRTPKEGLEPPYTLGGAAGGVEASAVPLVQSPGHSGSSGVESGEVTGKAHQGAATPERTHVTAHAGPTASAAPAASDRVDGDGDDDDDDEAILFQGALISRNSIVVDLVHSNTNSTPSQGVSPRAALDGAAATATPAVDAAATQPGASVTPPPPPPRALPVDSVRLCVEYLQHFATLVKQFEADFGESPSGGMCRASSYTSYDSRTSASTPSARAAREKETRPAALSTPLAKPLAALLSDWEFDFLYTTILQVPDSTRECAKKASSVCPEFDYRYPGMHLQREPAATALRDALRVPAPEKPGLVRLRELLSTAKQLRIDALVQLLTAWLADYMLRMCYCGADNFEAAHLIRFCFQVHNDFNRREMEYLKVENEWPANEEE